MEKKVVVFVVLFLVIFMTSCSKYNSTLTEDQQILMDSCILEVEEKNIKTSNDAFAVPKISTKDYCYNKLSISQKDFRFCEYIRHAELSDDCFFRYASATKDTKICAMIQLAAMRKNCELMAKPTFIPNAAGNHA
jgi:hypothetical protein